MKKIIRTTLLTSLLCSSFIAQTSLAAQVEEAESKGKVTFTNEENPLRVESATDIIFGNVEISGDTKTYDALYQDSDVFTPFGETEHYVPLNVTTVDSRGTNAGWKLLVKMDDQFKTSEGDLLHANLTLEPTHIETSKEQAVSRGLPSVLGESTELSPSGESAMMVNAKENEGIGTWTTFFGDEQTDTQDQTRTNDKVQLTVFGGNDGKPIKTDKEYSTTVTWSLLNTAD